MFALALTAVSVCTFLPNVMAEEDVAPLRSVTNLNREWKFALGDQSQAETVDYNDSDWLAVGLPHAFSQPYFLGGNFPVDYGWYRKNVMLPDDYAGRRIALEFDGVFQVAEVFLNGKKVGGHRGGYTGFSIDITEAARIGEENSIAVRVNNLWDPTLAPRAGEHEFGGGIYRDVRLVATDLLHVTWYGTFVTTPKVSETAATVNVKTEVANDSTADKNVTVLQQVFDTEGKRVAQTKTSLPVAAGKTVVFDQTCDPVANPRLWHPDHPFLYTVKTTILENGTAVDEYETPFGIRWFEWTADKGFFLNGKHLYLFGANVHQDHAGWCDAVTHAGARRDVQLVKDAGFNFIRGSHYPHSPAFSQACDETGVLFWSESVFWGTGGSGDDGFWGARSYPVVQNEEAAFEQSVLDQTREMIRIHRNHPSIVVWSSGNENFFCEGSTLPKVKALLLKIDELINRCDPSRPAANGGVQRGDLDKLGNGAVAGYNGDGARIFIDPGVPNIVSEYGSSIAPARPGKYEPGFGDLLNGGPGDRSKPYFWRYPWRSGEVIWCAFDHGSIAGINFGSMGMVDYFRLPKRQWYWYRNEYLGIAPPEWPAAGTPVKLSLTADKTVITGTDATDDVHLVVGVQNAEGKPLSNCPTVTLTVESGPGRFPTDRSITFEADSDIAIRDGLAAIEFRSYYAGTSVIRATSEGLKDAVLEITTTGGPTYVEGETPLAPAMPYKRYTAPKKTESDFNRVGNVSLDRPTRSSSETESRLARNVNDGKTDTFWQAADGDKTPWCGIDLERIIPITRIQITFPESGNYRYVIQVAQNETEWTTVLDHRDTAGTDAVRVTVGDIASNARFVRVLLTHVPPGKTVGIAELTVGSSLHRLRCAPHCRNRDRNRRLVERRPGPLSANPPWTANMSTFFDADEGNGAWVGTGSGARPEAERDRRGIRSAAEHARPHGERPFPRRQPPGLQRCQGPVHRAGTPRRREKEHRQGDGQSDVPLSALIFLRKQGIATWRKSSSIRKNSS